MPRAGPSPASSTSSTAATTPTTTPPSSQTRPSRRQPGTRGPYGGGKPRRKPNDTWPGPLTGEDEDAYAWRLWEWCQRGKVPRESYKYLTWRGVSINCYEAVEILCKEAAQRASATTPPQDGGFNSLQGGPQNPLHQHHQQAPMLAAPQQTFTSATTQQAPRPATHQPAARPLHPDYTPGQWLTPQAPFTGHNMQAPMPVAVNQSAFAQQTNPLLATTPGFQSPFLDPELQTTRPAPYPRQPAMAMQADSLPDYNLGLQDPFIDQTTMQATAPAPAFPCAALPQADPLLGQIPGFQDALTHQTIMQATTPPTPSLPLPDFDEGLPDLSSLDTSWWDKFFGSQQADLSLRAPSAQADNSSLPAPAPAATPNLGDQEEWKGLFDFGAYAAGNASASASTAVQDATPELVPDLDFDELFPAALSPASPQQPATPSSDTAALPTTPIKEDLEAPAPALGWASPNTFLPSPSPRSLPTPDLGFMDAPSFLGGWEGQWVG